MIRLNSQVVNIPYPVRSTYPTKERDEKEKKETLNGIIIFFLVLEVVWYYKREFTILSEK